MLRLLYCEEMAILSAIQMYGTVGLCCIDNQNDTLVT